MAIASFCDYCGAENTPGDIRCHACQHPLAHPAGLGESGTLLNERYALISEIGSGGFGAVYKARDVQEHDRLVAVKGINLQGLSSQEIIEATDAFNREAEILITLSHPLLPRIFDRFSDPEHWYLVMTYIDGETLDEYLQHHRVSSLPAVAGLPVGETLTIALQLCDVLHYLHSQQPAVIFRDLKPGNIMRTRKGRLYLIDFGIARRFKPGQAKDTIPFGSPGFAAPEQYGRAQTTPQADIYSLGALLYCLLTGDDPSEHPFDFPPLPYTNVEGIYELNELIQQMVALDPAKRPIDIQLVQAELQRIQQLNIKANQQGRLWTPPQGQTPPADGSRQQHIFLNPTSTPQKTRKPTRRAVLTTALVLGGVAAAGGLAALTNQSRLQPTSQVDPSQGFAQQMADAQNADATATAANQTPTVPLNGPTFWSPDMSYAAVANSAQQQIEIYQVTGQNLIQAIKTSAASGTPTIWWSSDNSKILVQSDSRAILAWDTINEQFLFSNQTATNGSLINFVSWSPDGQNCAMSYDYAGNTVFTILQANDGHTLFQKSLPASDGAFVGNVVWSPDSQYFAFPDAIVWSGGHSWSIGIWDSKTYQRVNLVAAAAPPDTTDTSFYSIGPITWSSVGKKLATIAYDIIYITQLGNNQSTNILPNVTLNISGSITHFIWSPDEQYLAILIEQSLGIWDTSNGQQAQIDNSDGDPLTNNVAAFAWGTDSKSVTVVDINNNVSQWSVD